MKLMVSYEYFTLVGTSPLAVANSLVWFLNTHVECELMRIHFICSKDDQEKNTKGTSRFVEKIKEEIRVQSEELKIKTEIEFDEEIIEIEEANLPVSLEKIGEHLVSVPDEYQIVLDCTAGRKTMTGAAILAGLFVINKFQKDMIFSYYWLLTYDKEFLKKRVPELGIDQAELKTFNAAEIKDAFSRLNDKCLQKT